MGNKYNNIFKYPPAKKHSHKFLLALYCLIFFLLHYRYYQLEKALLLSIPLNIYIILSFLISYLFFVLNDYFRNDTLIIDEEKITASGRVLIFGKTKTHDKIIYWKDITKIKFPNKKKVFIKAKTGKRIYVYRYITNFQQAWAEIVNYTKQNAPHVKIPDKLIRVIDTVDSQ